MILPNLAELSTSERLGIDGLRYKSTVKADFSRSSVYYDLNSSASDLVPQTQRCLMLGFDRALQTSKK